MKRTICALLASLGLAGCGGVPVERYAAQTPVLDLKQYFNGPVLGHGMFQDRGGEVIKRFVVRIDARWQGDTGTLDERFEWSDGTQSRRVWTLKHLGDGRYSGRADDVVGEAQGEARGNALRWRYVLALPVGDKVYNVDFDDWMYLIDDRVMLNRSAMSKFGIHLGEVTLSFTRGTP
ncbi:Putative exported protein [Methyloversatilis universalis FAM5]|jgi:hypothetical protein|uniref:Exported protein n=2 Tax=Pseudomonadota TaxID=1224 RepID=F5R7X4_METUF|nr:DUF3833 domain-containing protein [Methyloversatilis universalis]EGK73127.1 Putative exported protein [Methyloversatilis universalis FAM5]